MKIVCNSSPIIGLSLIGRLDLLWEIFEEVIIPNEVFNEITNEKAVNKVGAEELKAAVKKQKIKVYIVKNTQMIEQLIGRLHKGELEVIFAAKELGINRVIIDDKPARYFAETMLLKTIGLIGILVLAKDLGKIENIRSYMDVLLQNEYRISLRLYNEILTKENEL
ncbi:MAG: DUF3368 domain-containing protein [Thermoanaerobacteraceae bacterium]|nr:DUF3368 domain-containing protein [Thermoanaerobacteraceae bacterium]